MANDEQNLIEVRGCRGVQTVLWFGKRRLLERLSLEVAGEKEGKKKNKNAVLWGGAGGKGTTMAVAID